MLYFSKRKASSGLGTAVIRANPNLTVLPGLHGESPAVTLGAVPFAAG